MYKENESWWCKGSGSQLKKTATLRLDPQAHWMQWEEVLESPLSWKELWVTDQGKLNFLLRAVADLFNSK